MTILGIESSCDETSAAVVKKDKTGKITILSHVTATSLSLHAKTGGIIPEIAAREQIKHILPVISQALEYLNYKMGKNAPDIDAIAITYGPGLIGSLLVGIETAKTLSLLWDKPVVPINHLYGHIYANRIIEEFYFPALALVVSGGHTDLVLLSSHTDIKVIGQTRDDACGEAFDKIGRLLSLEYPAGAKIAELAKKGDYKKFTLPRPMIGSNNFDFSFSGLKTSVLNLIKKEGYDFSTVTKDNEQILFDLCASVQYSIVDVITKKTLKALKQTGAKTLLVGGGVAANESLKISLTTAIKTSALSINLLIPPPELCTDNGAMIAINAFFNEPAKDPLGVTAVPNLGY